MDRQTSSAQDWEQLYRETPLGDPPSGLYRGTFLAWAAAPRYAKVIDSILFDKLPYGIDFDRRLWWFVEPKLAMGRFTMSAGKSRWRATETFRLRYEVSLLPVRGILYDEVKPLPDGTCLGLGGVNSDHGAHFFFSLSRA
jgi:hypothetical protein